MTRPPMPLRHRLLMWRLRLKLAPHWLARQPGTRPVGTLMMIAVAAALAFAALLIFQPFGHPDRPSCVAHTTAKVHLPCTTPKGTPPP